MPPGIMFDKFSLSEVLIGRISGRAIGAMVYKQGIYRYIHKVYKQGIYVGVCIYMVYKQGILQVSIYGI